MPDLEIHRTGDRFVINAEADTFNVLLNLARQMHRPDREPGQAKHWLADLAKTLSRVRAQLPSRPSYPNMETAIGERDIPGVDFVSYTARVMLGVDRSVLQQISDCLEMVVTEGDDPDLHTLAGAFFPDIRSMYLTVAGALGDFKKGHRIAFPDGWAARADEANDDV